MADELNRQRINMHYFVEQRMALIAPNLVRILGAGSAAMVEFETHIINIHYISLSSRWYHRQEVLDLCPNCQPATY